MKMRFPLLLAVLAALLLTGCAEDEATLTLVFQVDGSVSNANVSWRDGAGVHQELAADLPWIHEFEAREGDPVAITVSHLDREANLWIRVLEEGEEVEIVPGCLCNGSYVSASTEGVVGHWAN